MASSDATMTPEEQEEKLCDVLSLAALFNTCVETFGLIHPSKALDCQQKIALTRLGIQQGRLLIFGNVVGISSPLATIATSMVPSEADDINPEPTSPMYFDPRDPGLDDSEWRKVVEATLREIVGRPAHLSREEMMELYGLMPPRRATSAHHPTLDTTRYDAFVEKYSLLHDLSDSLGCSPGLYRAPSITAQHWQIHDVDKFSAFVSMVRGLVDNLVNLFGCKERVDRGIRSDIKALGWHPTMPTSFVRRDEAKLKLILAACKEDYPEFVPVAEMALEYIQQELQEGIAPWPTTTTTTTTTGSKPTSEINEKVTYQKVKETQKETKKETEKGKGSAAAARLALDPLTIPAGLAQTSDSIIIQEIEADDVLKKRANALGSSIESFSQIDGIGNMGPKGMSLQVHVM